VDALLESQGDQGIVSAIGRGGARDSPEGIMSRDATNSDSFVSGLENLPTLRLKFADMGGKRSSSDMAIHLLKIGFTCCRQGQ